MEDRNNTLQALISKKKEQVISFKKSHKALSDANKTLRKQIERVSNENKDLKEYKENMESMNRYDIENIDGLSEDKLNQLQRKMSRNRVMLRDRRREINDDKKLCMICQENQKCILIQGCNHLDICEECKNSLPQKECPRCQKAFKKTIKVNHFVI